MKKIVLLPVLLVLISASTFSRDTQRSISIVRVYADSLGESHFEDISWKMVESEFAPPAPPLLVSDFVDSSSFGFISAAPGWSGEWHPTPKRQLIIYISGRIEATVSDGESRTFGSGDITLLEDTAGVGHRSKVTGDEQVLLAVIQLGE
jgi:quercetin dioxygenase-like cupin family protein